MGPVTKQCLDFAYSLKYEDIPSSSIEQMKKYVFDLLCCCLAGSKSPELKPLFHVFNTSFDTNGIKPFGGESEKSLEIAALLNGASAHALEMDDSDRTGLCHPGVMVIAPALVVASHANVSGKDFITACVAGYEVVLRVATALGLDHYSIWHTTATTGALGASVACAKLLGLNREQFGHAFGNAGTLSCGLWEFNRTYAMSKLLHAGISGMHAVLSVRLAQQGFTGADQILEGRQGLFAGYKSKSLDLSVFNDFHEFWRTDGVTFKPYPCCRHTHGGIDCGIELHDLKIATHTIKSIQIETYQAAYDVVAKANCKTAKQAKFSLPYTVVSALLDGTINEKSFAEDKRKELIRNDLLKRCSVKVAEDIQAVHPFHENCRVTLTLSDGQTKSAFVFDPLGEPENPMDWEKLQQKGQHLLETILSAEEFSYLVNTALTLDRMESCKHLYSTLWQCSHR